MSKYQYVPEPALVKGDHDFSSLTRLVTDINLRPTPKAWYLCMIAANGLLFVMVAAIGYLIWEGTGIWGLNNPVGWGWAIINFVWWVGIGHAGTLISAILFLFRQDWRTAINRFAEAMTIFAVMCAGVFPAIHVGRIWVIYWVFPVSKLHGNVAKLQLSTTLGRVCGIYLFHCFPFILVCRTGS